MNSETFMPATRTRIDGPKSLAWIIIGVMIFLALTGILYGYYKENKFPNMTQTENHAPAVKMDKISKLVRKHIFKYADDPSRVEIVEMWKPVVNNNASSIWIPQSDYAVYVTVRDMFGIKHRMYFVTNNKVIHCSSFEGYEYQFEVQLNYLYNASFDPPYPQVDYDLDVKEMMKNIK